MTKTELQAENDVLRKMVKTLETRVAFHRAMASGWEALLKSAERELRELNDLRGTGTKAASRKVRHLHVVPAGRAD